MSSSAIFPLAPCWGRISAMIAHIVCWSMIYSIRYSFILFFRKKKDSCVMGSGLGWRENNTGMTKTEAGMTIQILSRLSRRWIEYNKWSTPFFIPKGKQWRRRKLAVIHRVRDASACLLSRKDVHISLYIQCLLSKGCCGRTENCERRKMDPIFHHSSERGKRKRGERK